MLKRSLIVVFFAFICPLLAQNQISPGDTVQLFVWGIEEDISRPFTVRQDGHIFVPWAGDILAAGKTYDQLQKEITKRLSKYFKNFGVTVVPAEAKPFVSVLGQVRQIGPIEFAPGMTIAEAIALAGGLNENASGIVRIISKDNQVKDVDLNKVFQEKDLSENVALRIGDILFALPKTEKEIIAVTLLGRVAKPGVLQIPSGSDIFTAIAAGGGVTGEVVETRTGRVFMGSRFGVYNVQVNRKGKVIRKALLDASTMEVTEFKKESEPKLTLEDGDIVMVTSTKKAVAILGEVVAPGIYELEPGMRVSDLIVRSGGFKGDPYMKKSGVIREKDGKARWIDVNLEEVFRKGQYRTNIELEPKDIVFVPARTRRLTVDKIVGVLGKLFFPAQAINEIFDLIQR